ncbi:zinc ribbon domain-containing protein [Luteipulveratus flavus]|uniref:C4-type zinc ribbon domain-containing protein n=1 Tax=Luteipulveratus flavus TaxID=3031728 RepID=A0ABT6C5S8_9MICO|nr:C4-type zinc ribbon domain-containing protein [Luteipulveratus sp. YIM 133296]MDF8263424.1 C4-type zinc ribbon domain-containing protein [Luteipulveratus sp. YIM 133296]
MLDLQKLDTRLAQLDHRSRTLPVLQELSAAQAQSTRADEDLVLARTAVADVEREITKADQDVQLVRDRAARNTARLEAGQGSAKELQAMQHELDTLARRQSELEDVELEVMERAETLRAELTELERRRTDLDEKLSGLEDEHARAAGEIDTERSAVVAERAQIAPGLGEDLLALYEKVREQHGGLGAAPLIQRRCGGCQLELTSSDLSRIRTAPEDEVLRCEECRRILVRTAESGL